jgi:hypothetical protein
VGPRAGLDAGARRKIPCPCRGSNLDRPVVPRFNESVRDINPPNLGSENGTVVLGRPVYINRSVSLHLLSTPTVVSWQQIDTVLGISD